MDMGEGEVMVMEEEMPTTGEEMPTTGEATPTMEDTDIIMEAITTGAIITEVITTVVILITGMDLHLASDLGLGMDIPMDIMVIHITLIILILPTHPTHIMMIPDSNSRVPHRMISSIRTSRNLPPMKKNSRQNLTISILTTTGIITTMRATPIRKNNRRDQTINIRTTTAGITITTGAIPVIESGFPLIGNNPSTGGYGLRDIGKKQARPSIQNHPGLLPGAVVSIINTSISLNGFLLRMQIHWFNLFEKAFSKKGLFYCS
jgi:hypothetical protein